MRLSSLLVLLGCADVVSKGVDTATDTAVEDTAEVPCGELPHPADCDDVDAQVGPLCPERCNGLDDNCDGAIDEGLLQDGYADGDDDGYGDGVTLVEACEMPDGYVADGTDCDDTDAAVHPGAADRCNGVDDDCDGNTDEDDPPQTSYVDADGDGYGDPSTALEACDASFDRVGDGSDCDDADARVYPGAATRCDGSDGNCDGAIDVPDGADDDGDGYAESDGDCDDADVDVVPGATGFFRIDPGYDEEAVGADAGAPVVVDVDADGNLDVLAPSLEEGTVAVLLGDGSGEVDRVGTVTAANVAIAAGDVDFDSVVDLLVLEPDGDLAVYTGLGGGAFGAATTTATGCGAPGALAAADLDGDAAVDLVFGCGTLTAKVALSDGSRGFTLVSVALADDATQLHLGDVDADGDADATFAGGGGGALSLLRNRGGALALEATVLSTDAAHLAAGDFDGDGDTDFVTSNDVDEDLEFIENDGAGGFTTRNVPGGVCYGYTCNAADAMLAVDGDADGIDDVLLLRATAGWFGGTAAGPVAGTSPAYWTDDLQEATRADLDGDGVDDLVATEEGGLLSARRGAGDLTFGAPYAFRASGFAVESATGGDLDGDGIADLFVVTSELTLAWYLDDGAGNFTLSDSVTHASGSYEDAVLADFDGDGDLDGAAPIMYGPDEVTVLFNDGTGVVARTSTEVLAATGSYLQVADVDADGDADLLVVLFSAGNIEVLLNDGAGDFSSVGAFDVGGYTTQMDVGDFDGDGLVDVVAGDYYGKRFRVYRGDGAGSFTAVANLDLGFYTQQVAAGDLDGDGFDDVIGTGWQSNDLAVYLNDGTGTAFAASAVPSGGSYYALALDLEDVAGDGALDLILQQDEGVVSLWLGDGAGGFVDSGLLPDTVDGGFDPVRVYDRDGDGDLDIAWIAPNYGVMLLENGCCG